jgi:hypothetical protein
MRTLVIVAMVLAIASLASPALAWDGPPYWFDPANGAPATPYNVSPGGGGILGTGGAGDYNITCANCHVKAAGQIGLTLAFDGAPPPAMYTPGHAYQVTATMTGEHLGLSGCMGSPPLANNNNFAMTAEDDSGMVAGSFAADSGSSAACPPAAPDPQRFSTGTYLYGDCHAVLTTGAGRTSWSFTWTAPAAGAGNVTVHYAGVDGDCMMDSLNDDVKVGTITMGEGMASLRRRSSDANAVAWVGLFPVVGIAGARIRRRRRA